MQIQKIIQSLILVSTIAVASQATAGYSCTTTVNSLGVSKDGYVHANFEGLNNTSGVNVCNIATGYNGVTAEVCQGIYDLLLSAQLSGKSVKVWFDASNTAGTTCSSQQSWMPLGNDLGADGWYYGPVLLD